MKNHKIKLWLVAGVLIFSTLACSIPGIKLPSTSIDELVDEISNQVAVETKAAPEEAVQETQVANQVVPESYIIPDEVLMQDALVELYDRVSPGVVSIQVYSTSGSGIGSGFVIDKEGHIVTNYHVIELAEDVEVHFQSGLMVYGQVMGVDLDSDLAVIKVDVDPDALYPLSLGDSGQLRVGQTVVAIGNPYGLSGTMTVGIVSARGRTLESIRQNESGNFFSAGDLIQTDATINPGNSGGPLLNLNGEVIGINRAIQTGGSLITGTTTNTGIGFAVSSNILKIVLPALKNGDSYSYPYLGLSSLDSLTLAQAEFLGLSRANGAYVLEVEPGDPADLAGIRAGNEPTQVQGLYAGGDLIVGVDDIQILHFSELLSYMMLNKKPGDEMTITVIRDGQEMEFSVVLGERPANGQ